MSRRRGDATSAREAVSRHGLSARRSLGQHYLLDENLTRRIVEVSGFESGDAATEVGPGPGGLTRALLQAGASKVIAIEKDRRFVEPLEALSRAHGGRLEVIVGDALDLDIEAETRRLAPPAAPLRFVCAPPYNVASTLLARRLRDERRLMWRSLTLTLQRETAERLVAEIGTSAYGRLSVLAQATCRVSLPMRIPSSSFVPPPKVESSVARLDPLESASFDVASLETVTSRLFGSRRKMLRRSAASLFADPASAVLSAGLDPRLRAQDVDVSGFLRLAEAYRGASRVASR